MSLGCPFCYAPVDDDDAVCPNCEERLEVRDEPQRRRAKRAGGTASVGVTLFGVFNVITGVAGILLSIVGLLAMVLFLAVLEGGGGSGHFKGLGETIGALVGAAVGIGSLVALVPCLVLGIGLLRRRTWARALGLVASAFWIGIGALGLLYSVTGGSGDFSGSDGTLGRSAICMGMAYFAAQGLVLFRARSEFS